VVGAGDITSMITDLRSEVMAVNLRGVMLGCKYAGMLHGMAITRLGRAT
jgi:hypothetical protein